MRGTRTRYVKLRIGKREIQAILTRIKIDERSKRIGEKEYKWLDRYVKCYIPVNMKADYFIVVPERELKKLGIKIIES